MAFDLTVQKRRFVNCSDMLLPVFTGSFRALNVLLLELALSTKKGAKQCA